MTEASDAYAEAERRIKAAQEMAAVTLDLSGLHGLDRLPLTITSMRDLRTLDLSGTNVTDVSPIAQLPALDALNLSRTDVTDLSPLAKLPALSKLRLMDSQVTDLSPLSQLSVLSLLDLEGTPVTDLSQIAGLKRLQRLDLARTGVNGDSLRAVALMQLLVTDPSQDVTPERFRGLRLTDCAAARSDPRIAEIAAIEDPSTRARTLFEYLGLPVDGPAPAAQPDPDPLLPILIVNGQLEVAPDIPDAAERDDAVKQAVHPRLRDRADGLALLARNRLPRLNRRAVTLQGLLDRPFADLDLLAVHFEVEDLNDRALRGEEDGESFGSEVAEALSDIARLGPGLTRDNASVERHEERLARTRAAPPPAQDAAARTALSAAILAQPAAHGPRSLALEAAMADATDPARTEAMRQPKHRNMLWRLGVAAALRGETLGIGVTGGILANTYGPAITAFVNANWPLLMTVAQTYGASFAAWFVGTVGVGLFGKGVADEWRKRPPKT